MKTFFTNSPEETRQLAGKLSKRLTKDATQDKPLIIALEGELGSGKTVFVQGFAQALAVRQKVLSPTFVFHRIHKIPHSKKLLHHIDLYRLEKVNSLQELGLGELFSDPQSIILIEWPEKLGKLLPQNAVKIGITAISENERKITLS